LECRPATAESAEALTNETINAMNDIEIDVDQTDEQTLTYEVSDEALENAANTGNTKAGTLTPGLQDLCTRSVDERSHWCHGRSPRPARISQLACPISPVQSVHRKIAGPVRLPLSKGVFLMISDQTSDETYPSGEGPGFPRNSDLRFCKWGFAFSAFLAPHKPNRPFCKLVK
jgi:hypothetical protein